MKKIFKVLIILIVIVILVIGAVTLVKKRKEEDAKIPPAKIYPITIKAIKPKHGHIITTLKYLALVKSNKSILITSKFAGKINYIAKLAQKVKKGEIVVKIDDSNLKAQLKSINSQISAIKDLINADKINLQTLKDTHKRTEKLLKVKMASIEQYNLEKAKIASLKAKLKADESKLKSLIANKKAIISNLSYAEIKSPINGIVSAKFLNKGDNAFAGKPILKISANKGNYLFMPLAKPYKEVIYKNKIYNLIPLNSTFNGVPAYKADVNDNKLIEGEKVNVKVVTFDGNATLVPFNSILTINGKNYVFDTNKNPIEVHILASGEEGVVIKENLKNKLILKANPDILLKIKAGYPVRIVNE